MITANFMHVATVKNGKVQQFGAKKMQEDNLEAAEAFAGVMNQTMDISGSYSEESFSDRSVSKISNTSSSYDSYDRYSYKSNRIENAETSSATEKFEESADVLEQSAEEIVETISDAYDVDEETVQNLLDEMGLQALDLLNPQNLVSFLVALTGAASGEQLLLDENFLKVMEMVNNLTENLMNQFDVDADGLQELITVMNVETKMSSMENEEFLATEEVEKTPMEQSEIADNTSDENTKVSMDKDVNKEVQTSEVTESVVEKTQTLEVAEEVVEGKVQIPEDVKETIVSENSNGNVQSAEHTATQTMVVEDMLVEETEQMTTSESSMQQADMPEAVLGTAEKEFSFTEKRDNAKEHSFFHQNTDANQTVLPNPTVVNGNQTADVPQMQFTQYLSADTVQIMEQIVQQMKVNVTTEMTSMEMQLNPENLGKIFVNITTEEGIVNAKFQATTEVVKEALEVQIATLRENLNQAGVKVDAIEVTIASHEFERNLEQNQHKSEEQTEEQTNITATKRRNITMSSLDELSGLMTEEESLVAQIMKDNGNTVDLKA